MDTTRNARFSFLDYSKSVNDAIVKFINDRFGDIDNRNPYSFQFTQKVRDELYTLIKTATPTVSNLSNRVNDYYSIGVSRITNPTDYYDLISWTTYIDGIETYARPTTDNELGPLLEDSLKYPTNKRTYYVEDAIGFKFYKATTGTLTVSTDYIKTPATYTCGNENQLIAAGPNLTIGLDYIATQVSVNVGTTFYPGDQFTAVGVTLTSGQVILASNTVTCDLPAETHETIAKMAASILSGTVSDYNRSQFDAKEAKATN